MFDPGERQEGLGLPAFGRFLEIVRSFVLPEVSDVSYYMNRYYSFLPFCQIPNDNDKESRSRMADFASYGLQGVWVLSTDYEPGGQEKTIDSEGVKRNGN